MPGNGAYEAAKTGRFDEMIALVEREPEQARWVSTHKSYTLLHQAAWHGNQRACDFILQHHPDSLSALNCDGETPAAVAYRRGHTACAAALKAQEESKKTRPKRPNPMDQAYMMRMVDPANGRGTPRAQTQRLEDEVQFRAAPKAGPSSCGQQ